MKTPVEQRTMHTNEKVDHFLDSYYDGLTNPQTADQHNLFEILFPLNW